MKPLSFLLRVLPAAFLIWMMPGASLANRNIIQTIQLTTGWNAVFLEIEPDDPNPDTVFQTVPADKVLAYYPKHSPVQFIQDPDEIEWNKGGWSYWVPPNDPGSFLKTLFRLQANQAYLVHCTQDHIWQINGAPKLKPKKWKPDAFNLTGFYVNPNIPPTFSMYFGTEKAFATAQIYHLQGDKWKWLADPNTPIAPGKAYWIYSMAGSDYNGPLNVKLPGVGDELVFYAGSSESEVVISNRSTLSLSFVLEQVPNPPTEPPVPLSIYKFDIYQGRTYIPFSVYSPAAPLEPGKSEKIIFTVRWKEISGENASSLLKISDNMGNMFYFPVLAEK